MSAFVRPSYYHVFYRAEDGRWGRLETKEFITLRGHATGFQPNQAHWDLAAMYGISKDEVVVELFRINAGRVGYYLANLRDRAYHYCGTEFSSVREKLIDLGIGLPSN